MTGVAHAEVGYRGIMVEAALQYISAISHFFAANRI